MVLLHFKKYNKIAPSKFIDQSDLKNQNLNEFLKNEISKNLNIYKRSWLPEKNEEIEEIEKK